MAYIDVDLLKESVLGWNPPLDTEQLKHMIDTIPTADVAEVKHGRFVKNERNIPKMREFHEKGIALGMSEKSIFYTCSCCGGWISLSQKYCGECGAEMEVKDEQKQEESC